jgi:hypothetical protein
MYLDLQSKMSISTEKKYPHFKCLKCEHEFLLEKPEPTFCLKCGHLYVKWLNYDNFKIR